MNGGLLLKLLLVKFREQLRSAISVSPANVWFSVSSQCFLYIYVFLNSFYGVLCERC